MGSICSCCSKRERSVEDLLDGSLEDKLLGKRDDDLEVTTAEEEAWRQRRQQVKDEEDLSMKSLGDDEEDESRSHALVWDLSDRNMAQEIRKEATDLVEDEEEEEAFGSAKEDSNDDDQETKHVDDGGDFNLDRLTQLSARSPDDSYASVLNSYREDPRVFRDTELDNATEVSDTFLAPSSVDNSSFLVDDDDEGHEQEQQQKEEHDNDHDQGEDDNTEKHRSNSNSSSRKRSSKKKSRSKKSSRK
ncbi:hypothetical protein F441_10570 [Phytophthora nicotianae CJ01A1]|uniref:Uncharacterized protein n=2 Tax=Phytophthora nicotianae TaxID=4792 RepID=W2L195_PHYNI|nr:hypothetical protein L915_10390 [Phytophthora nicotianae]ETL38107.1 hypothetical protein L916_10287 [Phytophthora nicotianae]ETL91208.1 hypothetical protein L917_10223 [Phytophthora nicotianae]ETM44525.1 hypothetical protein L914_10252 [Phytophthora nicotianae]ETP14499.1 hypothetical protein F441_10570 [Phytophthora nicotianae CJ01A1]